MDLLGLQAAIKSMEDGLLTGMNQEQAIAKNLIDYFDLKSKAAAIEIIDHAIAQFKAQILAKLGE
jgi:hypothetical protein